MSNKFNGYSFSWTQPYNVNLTAVYGHTAANINNELERLDMIDGWVDAMACYPDAEQIIQKVQHGV
jgi:hypothetical protein